VSLLLVLLAAWYFHRHRDQLEPLRRLQWGYIAAALALMATLVSTTSLTFLLLVRLVGVRLRPFEAIALTFLANLANYLGPTRPGAAIKAMYLKGRDGLPYARFAAILAANGLLVLLVSGAMALVSLAFVMDARDPRTWILGGIALALVLIPMAAYFAGFRAIPRRGRVWDRLSCAATGFEAMKARKAALGACAGSIILQYLVAAAMTSLMYRALGLRIAIPVALLVASFTTISNFFTITPNNFGIQELVWAYLYSVTGQEFSHGLLAAGVNRGIHLILSFGLGPAFAWLLLRSTRLSLPSLLPWRRTAAATAAGRRDADPEGLGDRVGGPEGAGAEERREDRFERMRE